jgi:hypothetical protein
MSILSVVQPQLLIDNDPAKTTINAERAPERLTCPLPTYQRFGTRRRASNSLKNGE